MSVDLSIIIVNYNGEKLLKECLGSILSSQTEFNYEIIVVDNASTDASGPVLAEYPTVKTLMNHQNLGFSKANNQGAKIAQGEWIFLLNNDTILQPDTLQTLLSFAKTIPNPGLFGPKLRLPTGQVQRQGSALSQAQYRTLKPKTVNFLVGAALLLPKDVFWKVGGLDENYVFYNEDVDLCKTLMKAGYSLYYVPQAQLIHIGGASSRTLRPKALLEGFRGGLYLVNKHYPAPVFQGYRVVVGLWCLSQWMWHVLLGLGVPSAKDYAQTYKTLLRIILTNELVAPEGRFT